MKKILIRASMLPFDNPTMGEVLRYNLFGYNMGNLIFQASVVKSLMTDDDVEFKSIAFDTPEISLADYEEINSTYDCFVIPLANAFRKSFAVELNRITKFVRNLRIPCYVVGVGAQMDLKGETSAKGYEEQVHAFVDAILEKSSIIGVRGEATGDYLKKLGYKEDRDYMVIGCPSLFYYGDTLPKAEIKELTPDSRISVSRKDATPEQFHKFMNRQMEIFPNHWFIPQTVQDFAVQYAGVPFSVPNYPETEGSPHYPIKYDNRIYQEDRAPAFLNFRTWIDFLKDKDFAFGSRIHGNIAPVLAGVPAYVFSSDYRVQELAEYHNIPNTPLTEVREDTNIFEIYDKADFDGIHRGHKERFERYVSFLKKNGIANIYDGEHEYDLLPFDKKLGSIEFRGPEHSFCSLDEAGREERTFEYNIIQQQIIRDLRESRGVLSRELNRYMRNEKKKVSLDDSFSSIVKNAARHKLKTR